MLIFLIHLYLYVLKKYNFLDINECVLFRHLCPYECINLSGSFNCSCPVGTIYNRNTYKCIGEWANISIAKLNVSEYYSLGTWKLPRYIWASWIIGSLVTWRLPVWFVASLVHNRASPKWDDVMWWGGSYSYKIEIARFWSKIGKTRLGYFIAPGPTHIKVNFPFDLPWRSDYDTRDGGAHGPAARLQNAIMEQIVYQVHFPLESIYDHIDFTFR